MNSSNDKPINAAIIVAAGESSRLPGIHPKTWRIFRGKPLIQHSIDLFVKYININNIYVIYNAKHEEYASTILQQYSGLKTIVGGNTRQESVYNGLRALRNQGCMNVLIHDAARPFTNHKIIENVLESLNSYKAVIPAVSVSDTIKYVINDTVTNTLDRDALVATQTPQGFHYDTLLDLHKRYHQQQSATDDATLAEWAGIPVKIIAGDRHNVKITTQEDIEMLDIPAHLNIRTGMGFDVHQLIPQDQLEHIRLCGVDIPCDLRLEGHSDGDVGLHALTDAIFGAMALGDLGTHFPPGDPKWKGVDSSIFLNHARHLMVEYNFLLSHADITIIAQKPRISPYREAMRSRIADILHIPIERISVKATTTDGLGFTGRAEGIAAHAIVTLLAKN